MADERDVPRPSGRFEASARGGARAALIAAGLLAAVAVSFVNAVQNDFVFDDYPLIVNNPAVRTPLGESVASNVNWSLSTLSYRLDYALGGMDQRVFHLSSIVYHALTVLLVSAFLRASGASPWAAAAGALIFAVHPVQTDAVTFASGRREVLYGLFFTAGVLAFLRHRARAGVPALLLALGAYLLAVLGKGSALVMPLVWFVHSRWSARAGRPRKRWAVSVAMMTMAGVLVFAGAYGSQFVRALSEASWHGGSMGAHFATVARVWLHYLGLVLWPARLSADYSYRAFPVSAGLFDSLALVSLTVLAVVAAAAWRSWQRGGLVGLGAAWCAVTLLPVAQVVPQSELIVERYLYVPMVGVALVTAGLVDALAARAPERRRLLAAAVLIVACSAAARTIVRNRDWRDNLSLWSATVAVVPNCARARFNLGQAYFERMRRTEAEREWLAAQAIDPRDADVELALATLYYQLAMHEAAAARVEAALRLEPDDPKAQALAGWIALNSGHPESAVEYFDAALARAPGDRNASLGRERAAQALNPPDQKIMRLKRGQRPD